MFYLNQKSLKVQRFLICRFSSNRTLVKKPISFDSSAIKTDRFFDQKFTLKFPNQLSRSPKPHYCNTSANKEIF